MKQNQVIQNNLIQKYTLTENDIDDPVLIRRLIKKLEISGAVRILYRTTRNVKDVNYETDNRFWTELHFWDWNVSSTETLFRNQNKKVHTLYFLRQSEYKFRGMRQVFREGENNCLIYPLYQHFRNHKSKTGKAVANKALKLLKKYPNGVPEEDIEGIANYLKINIVIGDAFGNNTKKYGNSIRNTFTYRNTSYNHVDLVINSSENNVEFETQGELVESFENEDTCVYYKDNTNVSMYQTPTTTYTYKNDYRDYISKFNEQFSELKIDYNENIHLSEYIRSACMIAGTMDYRYSWKYQCIEGIKQIDQRKAYTQFNKNPGYRGFLAKPTDFRKVSTDEPEKFLEEHIGIFEINNISNVPEFYKKWGFVEGIRMSSPMLLRLIKLGITFNIVSGCWGQRFDWEYDTTMKNEVRADGVKYYCAHSGSMMRINKTNNIYCKVDSDMAQVLSNQYPGCTVFGDELQVKYKNECCYHMAHIGVFVYDYARMFLIDQIEEMDKSKILRICVDGIYYVDHPFNVIDTFREKEFDYSNLPCNETCETFITFRGYPYIPSAEYIENYRVSLYSGAGGCGKTYSVLTDPGFVDLVYVAPSWQLTRKMVSEHSCQGTVLARLLNKDCFEKFVNNVIVIDECSMITENDKELIINKYPYSKIIFCGDIGYQLPPIVGSVMTLKNIDFVKDFKFNYRFKCSKLKKLNLKFRKAIEAGEDNDFMIKLLKKYIDVKEINYSIQDAILCSKHKYCTEWDEKYTGKFSTEKYLVKKNSDLVSNGDIIISDTKPKNSDIAHAFTIHSFQGKTHDGILWIDLRELFDFRMIYVAISRVRKISQLRIIMRTG